MPDRSVPAASPATPPQVPLVAAGAGFAGLVHVRGAVRIDGEVEGEIVASDAVWIAASGRVRARVEAPEVVVAGTLIGEIHASTRVELRASAQVSAVVRTPRLALADGAFFEGRCVTAGGAPEARSAAAFAPISAPPMA